MKYFINSIIVFLSLIVILMLTSFIIRISSKPIDASLDDNVSSITAQNNIQINVLNGCGKNGLAAATNEYLRKYKFDVLEIGNYDDNIDKSMVIDRLGDIKSAKKVAYALGINDSLIITKIDSSLFVRSTVVIGNDYENLNVFKKQNNK